MAEEKASTSTIRFPKRETETEIVFYLFNALRGLGLNVRASVPFRCSSDTVLGSLVKGKRRRTLFCDLVIFNEANEAGRIIEVKKAGRLRNKWKHIKAKVCLSDEFQCWYRVDHKLNKQLPEYRRHRIPVDVVIGMRRAEQYVEWLRARGRPERSGTEPSVMD
jgi:hypothetical protein